jgi:poly-gamma-glutamate synthesis protein (capsule biosynthesis protein)
MTNSNNPRRNANQRSGAQAPRSGSATQRERHNGAKDAPRGSHARPSQAAGASPRRAQATSTRTPANRPARQAAPRNARTGANVKRAPYSQVTLSPTRGTYKSAPAGGAFPKIALFALLVCIIAAVGFFAVHACTRSASVDTQDQTALTATEDDYTPEAQTTTLTVTFAGDCTLGTDEYFSYSTSFNAMYEAVADPSYFLKNVNALFSADDLTVVNMEGTLTTSTTRADKTYAFKGDAEYTQVFTTSSVEAASVANNHSHDYGDQSYTDTINAMEAAGIPTFGYDRIAYMDVKGVKVALIGTYELAEGLGIKDSMVENIQTARAEGAQLVMVYFHWGIERDTVPNSTQISLAHAAVDAGADLVVGSHPHVIQGWEKYNGKYIVYSLGNFCFGGNSNPSDKDCMIFQQTFTITGDEVATDDQVSFIAASISSTSSSNNYQPTIAEGSEKTRIEAKIQESTDSIAALVASGTY